MMLLDGIRLHSVGILEGYLGHTRPAMVGVNLERGVYASLLSELAY